jgi:hypothetical protein
VIITDSSQRSDADMFKQLSDLLGCGDGLRLAAVSSVYCAVVQPEPAGYERRTRHTWGVPPEDRLMPWPVALVIEESAADAMLFRYAPDGTFAGDTWHETVEDAKDQAAFEYDALVSGWERIPEGEDATSYALARARANDASSP